MSRTALIAVELALVAAAGCAIYLIVGWPFGSSAGSENPDRHAVLISDQGPRTPVPITAPAVTPATISHISRDVRSDIQRPNVNCGLNTGGDVLDANQVITYYGHPYTDLMGVLGELDPAALVTRVKEHAATYDALNGDLGARPAMHMVYATAQSYPGNDGKYLLYVGDDTLQEYLDLACSENMLFFLDLQFGLADVESEVRRVLPYLAYPNVHLALDPEFKMADGQIPGEEIGSLDAEEINAAQALVQGLVEQHGLEDKIIIVHQFMEEMITRPELLQDFPRIRLVVDMDGFGPADVKQVKFGWFAAPAEYSGIKLFFRHDPDLMPEADVIGLGADVVVYQ